MVSTMASSLRETLVNQCTPLPRTMESGTGRISKVLPMKGRTQNATRAAPSTPNQRSRFHTCRISNDVTAKNRAPENTANTDMMAWDRNATANRTAVPVARFSPRSMPTKLPMNQGKKSPPMDWVTIPAWW